jgi:hypothetical protein
MTEDEYDFAFSRRVPPEVLHFVVPPRKQSNWVVEVDR